MPWRGIAMELEDSLYPLLREVCIFPCSKLLL